MQQITNFLESKGFTKSTTKTYTYRNRAGIARINAYGDGRSANGNYRQRSRKLIPKQSFGVSNSQTTQLNF